jgi:hypothetical protein
VIISPRPAHSSGIFVVWDNIVVVRELFVADRAYSILLGDFPPQKFPHFGWGSEFSIAPRMVGICNAANPGLYRADALRLLATATAK